MTTKTPVEEFPYKTYLNILHGPLHVIDVQKLADACTDKWYNQTLCKVNDSVVRMAVVQGEYHWHEHKDIDEFFFVLDGKFLIDLEDRVIELARAVLDELGGGVCDQPFAVAKPDGLVVIVDSIQKGDQPAWDGLLDLFPHYFHEPYYAEYANQNLEALCAAAGLAPVASERAFLSKVAAFAR